MLKLKFVYICDICNDVKLPDPWGMEPDGWKEVKKLYLCNKCAAVFEVLRFKTSEKVGEPDVPNG